MYNLEEVFRDAEKIIITAETRLNNTLPTELGFEDLVCGFHPVCGLDPNIVINDNSEILISAGQSKNSGSSDVITGGLELRETLSDPFEGGTALSIGNLRMSYRQSLDKLHLRDWDDKKILVKAGGKLNGKVIKFDDYPTFFTGKSNGYDYTENSMQVSISLGANELNNIFPRRTYRSGEARGDVIPYLFGTVRNYAPVNLGNGLYQYQDDEFYGARTISAAYNNGAALTFASSDTSTTPTSGTYHAGLNYIKVNPDDDMLLTLDVQGPEIASGGTRSDEALNIIGELIRLGCNERVPVTFKDETLSLTAQGLFTAVTEQIGWVFDTQKTVREHLDDVLTPLDLYFTENKSDNGITVRRRYNGRARDINGDLNLIDTFSFNQSDIIEGSVRRIKTENRPRATRVFYNRNWNVLDGDGVPSATRSLMIREFLKTSSILSPAGNTSARVIRSPIINETDADAFAVQTAARDGGRNERFEFRVVGTRADLFVGGVGTVEHPLLPSRGFAEIRSITTNTFTRETNLLVIIYE